MKDSSTSQPGDAVTSREAGSASVVRKVRCGNCDWTGTEVQLGKTLCEIHRLWERLTPGGEVPAGECPECGALAYLVKEEAPAMTAMTLVDAKAAWAHAQRVIAGCESVDDLDEASDAATSDGGCPEGFTTAQRALVHRLVLESFRRAVGRDVGATSVPVWPVYTEAAERQARRAGERGNVPFVEDYTNAADAEQVIYLHIDEREEFESDAGVTLDADVLPPELFNRLLTWLKEGGAL